MGNVRGSGKVGRSESGRVVVMREWGAGESWRLMG